MEIEKLDLDVRLYNAVKRAGIHTVEDLLEKLYQHDSITKIGARNIINIEKALKKAGIRRYARGDYITEDDILPEPLTWDQLHGMVGQLVALDISTQSQTAYRVVWLYSFNDDDTRLIFQHDGNGYGNTGDHGEFYALKQEEPEMIEPGMRALPADESLAVTEQYTEAYNLNMKIRTSMQAIQQNLYDMCSALKRMRDGKLYKELGYQNFEDYCRDEAGITRQHAYKYIAIIEKLPADFVASVRQIGMHKLQLLTALTDDQREQIAETVDLESTTVRELKAQIAALQSQNADTEKARLDAETRAQQWYDKAQDAEEAVKEAEEAKERNRLTLRSLIDRKVEQVRQLEAKISELENRPQDVAVMDRTEEIDRLNAEITELRGKLAEKPDMQMPMSVEPIYRHDTKAVYNAYLRSVTTALENLCRFIRTNRRDANHDYFEENFRLTLENAVKSIEEESECL